MATLTVTHLGSPGDDPIRINEVYAETKVGDPLVFDYSANSIPQLKSLMEAMAAGTVSLSVAYTADEIASGLHNPPQVVEAADIAPVLAADYASGAILVRVDLVAGGGGSPDDTPVYAAGALPSELRVVDMWGFLGTSGGTVITAEDEAAGAGTTLASVPSTGTGRVDATTADGLAAPSATTGLFVRRSDDAAEGVVYLLLRPERS